MELIDLRAILIVALIFIPLERLLPLHSEQKMLRPHWRNDLVYLFLNGIMIQAGFFLLIGLMLAAIRLTVPDAVAAAVQTQPIWLQVVEIVLVADVGFYLAHRTFHSIPFLWKFHAVHHSIEEMDWLAAQRVHPVDQILTKATSYLPVFALGFSVPAIGIFALIYHWQALLIHSNTRINFGPLRWIVASPQFHHWHHANEREAYDKNFASQLPLLDIVGGTLFLPDRMPGQYGTDEPVPPLYHQQLAYPLRQDREGSPDRKEREGDPDLFPLQLRKTVPEES